MVNKVIAKTSIWKMDVFQTIQHLLMHRLIHNMYDKAPRVANALRFNIKPFKYHNSQSNLGPMIDNGSSLAAIRFYKLFSIAPIIKPGWTGELDEIFDACLSYPFRQYGAGDHFRKSRKIIGSTYLTAPIIKQITTSVRFLVLQGASQSVIGDNLILEFVIDLPDNSKL